MLLHPTPIAATAIIAQIETRADSISNEFYATINGEQWEFTAAFKVDWHRFSDERPGSYWEADVYLIGAWSFDPDTDEVRFAGNREETEALLGVKAVVRWEGEQAEREEEE